jgi:TM2 domain-containing membrane protein YozV
MNQAYQKEDKKVESSKSRLVALLLCIFVGVLGIHRFYVDKIGTGVVWLLTGGVFGIGVLVDLVMIIVGNFKDKSGAVLTKWQ